MVNRAVDCEYTFIFMYIYSQYICIYFFDYTYIVKENEVMNLREVFGRNMEGVWMEEREGINILF